MKQLTSLVITILAVFQLSAQTVTIPDSVFLVKIIEAGVDLNRNGTIELSEALQVKSLDVSKTDSLVNINFLRGIEAFENLEEFVCNGHFLLQLDFDFSSNTKLKKLELTEMGGGSRNINLSSNLSLEELDINTCGFEAVDVSNNLKLINFICHTNSLENLDVSNNSSLLNLFCHKNDLAELDVSQNPELRNLNCSENPIGSLDVSNNLMLKTLACAITGMSQLDISNNEELISLVAFANGLRELDLSNNPALRTLWLTNNRLSALDVSNNPELTVLFCNINVISELEVSHLANLERLSCGRNLFNSIDYSQNLNLLFLDIESLKLGNVDVTKHSKLFFLNCSGNLLTELDVSQNIDLQTLDCSFNDLSQLDLSENTFLENLSCERNILTEIDIRRNPLMTELVCYSNFGLKNLLVKNGSIQNVDFRGNRDLEYLCADVFEIEWMNHLADSFGLSEIVIDDRCPSPIADGFYQIVGNTNLEYEHISCEDREKVIEVKYNIINDTFRVTPLASFNGLYTTLLKQGDYTIKPQVINSPYFNITPDSINISLGENSADVINTQFCVSPKIIVQDLNVSIYNTNRPRSGDIGHYKVKVTNNGTTVESGELQVFVENLGLTIVDAEPPLSEHLGQTMIWQFEDLLPFQTLTYCFSAMLNGPQDDPAINDRDVLKFYAIVDPVATDRQAPDNFATLCQTIRNSYDPNDKTCLQGNAIFEERIGEYVFYRIRFENTGSADALDILIRDEIDPERFELSTLQITESSHKLETKIVDLNTIEFSYEDINLSFEEGVNTGYLVYKLRLRDDLVVGDIFENNAEIFFDNNFPIVTNTASTIIIKEPELVGQGDRKFLLNVYPNPSYGVFTISSSDNIQAVNVYDAQGRLVHRDTFQSELTETVTPLLDPGLYMVEVVTALGSEVTKAVVGGQ